MGILTNANTIKEKIDAKEVEILVIGLGKMGLPIVVSFTNAGFKVKGFDISKDVVKSLNAGKVKIAEPFVEERLKSALNMNLFFASTDLSKVLKNTDFVIVIIPILIDDTGNIILETVTELYKNLEQNIEKGTIIIQESTLSPSTTQEILLPILEANGKIDGKDFGLVFAPERTFSGRALADIEERYPKVLGPTHEIAGYATKLLYSKVAKKGVIQVSDATTAEAIKVFKGVFRDTNIGLANELAIIADKLKVDIIEIIKVSNTEPFSMLHTPGIGVGGHCIPVYPHFAIQEGKKRGYVPSIIPEARKKNDEMVNYAIEMLNKAVPNWERNVLIMGLAYRGSVKEHRFSPAIRLISELYATGINRIRLIDPLYTKKEIDEVIGKDIGWENNFKNFSSTLNEAVTWASVIIIVTDHEEFKLKNYQILSNKIVYDGRYVLSEKLAKDFFLLQPGRMKFLK